MTGPADRNEALQRAYDENVQLKQAMGSESWEAMMEAEIEAELSAFRKEALLE
jgi:acetoin utilization deacetylase AcuC-like enzyme